MYRRYAESMWSPCAFTTAPPLSHKGGAGQCEEKSKVRNASYLVPQSNLIYYLLEVATGAVKWGASKFDQGTSSRAFYNPKGSNLNSREVPVALDDVGIT